MKVSIPRPRQTAIAVQQAVESSKRTLRQVREVADPRTIAAGFVGLTAGEIAGGTVGGLVGIVVGGPAGAAIGGQVGAFTVGMVGLKLGTEAMDSHLQARGTVTDAESGHSRAVRVGDYLRTKSGERVGEIAGLTSGAAVGIVVAGPIGGLIGAVVGEAVGGQVGEDVTRRRNTPDQSKSADSPADVSRWIENLGRTTAGEGAVVLAVGTVGSVFGPSGRAIGQRLGLIVGRRVQWQKTSGTDDVGNPDDERSYALIIDDDIEESKYGVEDAGRGHGADLTNREMEVLALYAAGMSTTQIASEISVRQETVKRHLRRICRKLDVPDAEAAAAMTVVFVPVPADEDPR